jgi:hypothetical protein
VGARARERPLGLIQAARSALIAAKTSGKAFEHYSADSAACGHCDAGFESEVARALEARQFQLFLQPPGGVAFPSGWSGLRPCCAGTGTARRVPLPLTSCRCSNASASWESCRWVIQQAAQVLATLADAGCDVAISVNLVADDLKDPELPCSSVKPAKPGGCRYPGCVSNSPRVAWYRGMACR